MRATVNGLVVAESEDVVEFDGYSYFPDSSVRRGALERSPRTDEDRECPFDVQFYDVVVDGNRHERAAWTYEKPPGAVKGLGRRVGFWKDVEVR